MLSLYKRVGLSVGRCEVLWVRHARMMARKPVRVHLPVVDEARQTLQQYDEMLTKKKNAAVRSKTRPEINIHHEKEETIGKKEVIKTNKVPELKNDIQHQLLADAKDNVRTLLHNMSSRKFRDKHELFVAEGRRIIKEALDVGAHPEAIFFTRLNQLIRLTGDESKFGLDELFYLNSLPLYRTPYKTLQTWSSLTTSPGIVGVFKMPTRQPDLQAKLPLSLVLDEVREPTNMGGILRTAASVGATNIILMKGCCDPWECKVVRAGCGAHFRLKLTLKAAWDTLSNQLPDNTQLLVADMCRGTDPEPDEVEEEEEMLSNHPVGSSPQQKIRNPKLVEEELACMYEVDSEGNKIMIDPSYNNEDHLSTYESVQLPVSYYDRLKVLPGDVDSTVIIIGGETGLSNAAKKFAAVNCGTQVAIPLANGMDSLNSSVASGIILYEISKQYRQ